MSRYMFLFCHDLLTKFAAQASTVLALQSGELILVQMLCGQAPELPPTSPRAGPMQSPPLIHGCCCWLASAATAAAAAVSATVATVTAINLAPHIPQTTSRHVHMCWATMPIAWRLALLSVSPGLSQYVSVHITLWWISHSCLLFMHHSPPSDLTKFKFQNKIIKNFNMLAAKH